MRKEKIQEGETNLRAVIIALVVACALMIGFGIGYNRLAFYVSGPTDSIPLPPDALAKLSMQMGDWSGKESPLDEKIIERTDTDAHVSRTYTRASGAESVWAYVAYGVRARDLMPHRPEVCYLGAGWTLDHKKTVELPLNDGSKLGCVTYAFSRGSLNGEKVVLLNYYIVDGQYCSDVALLRSKSWLGSSAIGYVAQVEIVSSVKPGTPFADAIRTVSDFAVESAQLINELFDCVEKEPAVVNALDN